MFWNRNYFKISQKFNDLENDTSATTLGFEVWQLMFGKLIAQIKKMK